MPDKPEQLEGGWSEYRKLVVVELERLNSQINEIERRLVKMQVELQVLKVKATLAGAGAGLLLSAVVTQLVKVL